MRQRIHVIALGLATATVCAAGLSPADAQARDRYYSGPGYAAGPPAHAPAHGYRSRHATARGGYDWAEVVRVDPRFVVDHRPVRHHECWEEPVHAHYQRVPRQGSDAGVVLGAIVGGVVGNQFGGGRGRVATTAAGAALGGAVARDMQRDRAGGYEAGRHVVYEERCEVVTEHVRHERIEGYDVTYRYGGRQYTTFSDHHPGDRIQVRVDVVPVR